MHTRADYMDGKCTHAEYYAQFVTDRTRAIVAQRIGLPRIKASKDPHLNDIPLAEWDGLHGSIMDGDTVHALKSLAGDVCANTLGNSVCIAKEAARQLKAEA